MALREIIARFGFQVDGAGLKKAETGIAGVLGSLRTFGAVIAGSAIVRGVNNFVKDVVRAGDELGKTSAQLGVGVTELQRWQAAAQFSGASTQEFNTGLRTFAKNALLAQQGSKQAADAFDALGVDIEDSNGTLKTSTVLMREAGLALGKIENNTERVALAQQLFGRAGTKLLPLFGKTSEELDKLLGRLDELGGGFSENAVKLSEEAADAFLDLELATTSLKSQIAEALLPGIRDSVRSFAEWLGALSKNKEALTALKAVLVTLGFVIGKAAIAKFGGTLLRLGRAALLPLAKFLLLFLVVDDLIALFEGRGSLIGELIDKIFGKGTAKAVIDAIKGIGSAIGDLLATGDFEAFDKALEDIFGPLGQDIVSDIVFTFDLVKEALDQFIDETGEGFDLVISDLGQFFSEMGDGFSAGALGIANDAADLAEAIVDGIVEGITDGADAILTALSDVVTGAIDAIKKKLRIGSPSRVAGDEVGQPIVEGVVSRMQKLAGPASQQASTALRTAAGLARPQSVTATARGPGAGGGGPGGGIIFQSEMNVSVTGGSPSDPQIQKLRQGVRSALRENRRATFDALTQRVETA